MPKSSQKELLDNNHYVLPLYIPDGVVVRKSDALGFRRPGFESPLRRVSLLGYVELVKLLLKYFTYLAILIRVAVIGSDLKAHNFFSYCL